MYLHSVLIEETKFGNKFLTKTAKSSNRLMELTNAINGTYNNYLDWDPGAGLRI